VLADNGPAERQRVRNHLTQGTDLHAHHVDPPAFGIRPHHPGDRVGIATTHAPSPTSPFSRSHLIAPACTLQRLPQRAGVIPGGKRTVSVRDCDVVIAVRTSVVATYPGGQPTVTGGFVFAQEVHEHLSTPARRAEAR